MNTVHISNLNSLSALFDRLIIENIKKEHFALLGNDVKVKLQQVLVDALTEELSKFLTETVQSGRYSYISENRTFELKKKVVEFIENVLELCKCHVNITFCDQQKLKEIETGHPNVNLVIDLEYRNRVNLERRSQIKNNLDQLYENILHTVEQKK